MKRNNWNLILGIVLIIAAAALYVRDMKGSAVREAGAKMIRACAEDKDSVSGVFVFLDTKGEAQPFALLCPKDAGDAIINGLASAQPAKLPRTECEADEYIIMIAYTNNTQTIISSVRRHDSANDLFVCRRVPGEINSENKVTKWVYSPPALVPGLGETMNTLATNWIPKLRANARQYSSMITNMFNSAAAAGTESASSNPPETDDGIETSGEENNGQPGDGPDDTDTDRAAAPGSGPAAPTNSLPEEQEEAVDTAGAADIEVTAPDGSVSNAPAAGI